MRTIHILADDVGVEPTEAINQTLFSKQAHYRSVNHPMADKVRLELTKLLHPTVFKTV